MIINCSNKSDTEKNFRIRYHDIKIVFDWVRIIDVKPQDCKQRRLHFVIQ